MRFKKKVIAHLNKCYSIAPLFYNNSQHFLVAAEKEDPCYLFDMEGNLEETVWQSPGGVMSMVQLPGWDGQFLATSRFYSPNDSADASIVLATPLDKNNWKIQTLCRLPFVHRFDILAAGDKNYLVACTLKSDHAHKDDWSSPGKVYACLLPEDLSIYGEDNPLPLTVIKDNMLKNHGFYRTETEDGTGALISSADGVFHFHPPVGDSGKWDIKQLLNLPASDAALIDLDHDGCKELVVISPFHGSEIIIYRQDSDNWTPVYTYRQADFSHAIWCGKIGEKNVALIGHRQGSKSLLQFEYDSYDHQYKVTVIDEDCGPANVLMLGTDQHPFLVSANREIDEIAIYQPIF